MNSIQKLIGFKALKCLKNAYASFCLSHSPKLVNQNVSYILKNDYDFEYYLNPNNWNEILNNIKCRDLNDLDKLLENCKSNDEIKSVIYEYIDQMPNKLDPKWTTAGSQLQSQQLVEIFGSPKNFRFKVKKFENLARKSGLLYLSKNDHIGTIGGHRAYTLFGDLALLEQGLIDWTLDELIKNFNFTPIVVPNLVYEEVIKGCGYNPRGKANQVYKIKGTKTSNNDHNSDDENGDDEFSPNDVCLIGTSEIPLTAFHIGQTFEDKSLLPKKYCAVSRCYRAELSSLKEEAGLYRVPYFTKVEMYAITEKDRSNQMLEEFIQIQKYLFSKLDLHCRIIDMPPHELGISASRKYDIEVWLPGKRMWGEISSASNCTDFQSRRFNIKYNSFSPNYETNELFQTNYVHTVNGTASAIPRMLIALVENNQQFDGTITIPKIIQQYMNGKSKMDHNHDLFLR